MLMKDQPAPILSTTYASILGTICLKIGFYSQVKAVNQTSSCHFSRLSHFSVDNPV